MSIELSKQALELFDTPEKWLAFSELADMKTEISFSAYRKIQIIAKEYFNKEIPEVWSYRIWNNWDYKWFLKEFGENSFGIWMWGPHIGFYSSFQNISVEKIQDLINSSKYEILKTKFRLDNDHSNDFVINETGNFKFNSIYDGEFDYGNIVGYIINEPDIFFNQIKEKVNSIIKDEEITNLLIELNTELKQLSQP